MKKIPLASLIVAASCGLAASVAVAQTVTEPAKARSSTTAAKPLGGERVKAAPAPKVAAAAAATSTTVAATPAARTTPSHDLASKMGKSSYEGCHSKTASADL